MSRFKELEELYEQYNYKQMNKEQLRDLIKQLLTDREVFTHFYLYEVAKDVL